MATREDLGEAAIVLIHQEALRWGVVKLSQAT
jgi:hypothetical protein